jgi:putative restriction endonuclease
MNIMSGLNMYAHKFTKLRRDPAKGWPTSTLGKSPYKPLLLLAVLDQFDQGQITQNLIELMPDLGNLFDLYCAVVLPPGMACNIAMPFFHMQGEGFWHLVPLPGKEAFVASGRRLISESQLANNVAGARLDDELFVLLTVKESRDILRAALIEAHFDELMQPLLWRRYTTNQEAFVYSNELLTQARRQLKELQLSDVETGFAAPWSWPTTIAARAAVCAS